MQNENIAIIIQPDPNSSYSQSGFSAHIINGRLLSVQGRGGITQPEDFVGILHKDDHTIRWESFLWSHYTSLYLLIESSEDTRLDIVNGESCVVNDIGGKTIKLSTGGKGSLLVAVFDPIVEGIITISPDVVSVGETQEFTIDFTVGESGINTGGGIRIQTPYSSWSFPKLLDDSIKLNHFSNAKIEYKLEPYFHPMAVFGYVYDIRVTEGKLVQGDSIQIKYTDGINGIKVQSYPKSNAYFPVHIDATGKGIYYPMSYDDTVSVCVQEGPPKKLRLAMPMVIGTDEKFDLNLVVLDDNYNPVFEAFTGSLRVVSESANIDVSYNVQSDEYGLITFKGMYIKNTGFHVFTATGDSLESASLVVKCVDGIVDEKLYWGAMHGHTGLSDGEGDPDDYYPYARNIGLLDFAAIADHDWELAEHERSRLYGSFRYTQDIADAFNDPGEFVTIPGYEWMGNEGHANVYFNNEKLDNHMYVGNISIVGDAETDSFAQLLNHYKGQNDIMIIPHTSHGFKWTEFDPALMPVLEIYSCWGPSEFKDNPSVQGAIDGLNKGFRLGFIGGADSHHSNPGNTCKPSKYHVLGWREGFAAVYANQLTRDSVFNGIKSKNCYASTAERIYLEFYLNKNKMGSDMICAAGDKLVFSAIAGGTKEISKIDLICNGDIIYSENYNSQMVDFNYETEMIYPTGSYFYVRVTQADNEIAWSSSIWVNI